MKAHLAGATALLFPSHVEGFGLPPFEATSLGTPTITSPLRSVEIYLGDNAIYADPGDMYQWFQAIRELASEELAEQSQRRADLRAYRLPSWEKHFDLVFGTI